MFEKLKTLANKKKTCNKGREKDFWKKATKRKDHFDGVLKWR